MLHLYSGLSLEQLLCAVQPSPQPASGETLHCLTCSGRKAWVVQHVRAEASTRHNGKAILAKARLLACSPLHTAVRLRRLALFDDLSR